MEKQQIAMHFSVNIALEKMTDDESSACLMECFLFIKVPKSTEQQT